MSAATGAGDSPGRDQLHERLKNLSTILPVFAQELAAARRQAAELRVENARLLAELARLRDEAVGGARPAEAHASAALGGKRLLAGVRAIPDRDRRGDRGAPLGA